MVVVDLSSLARILRERSTMYSQPALFSSSSSSSFFFFVEFSSRKLIHSLGQDQSTVVQRAEMTVAERSLASCV